MSWIDMRRRCSSDGSRGAHWKGRGIDFQAQGDNFGRSAQGELAKAAKGMTSGEQRGLLVELLLRHEAYGDKVRGAACKLLGVNREKIAARVKAEAKAKEKAKPAPKAAPAKAAKPKAKAKSAPKAKAKKKGGKR